MIRIKFQNNLFFKRMVFLAMIVVLVFILKNIISNDKLIKETKAKNLLYTSSEKEKESTRNLTEVAKQSKQDSIDWCKKKHVTSTGGFCLNKDNIFDGGNYLWDAPVCGGLEDLFGANTSVGDFGAGLGHYGRCFYRISTNVVHSNKKSEKDDLINSYKSKMEAANLSKKPQVIRTWKGYDGALNIEEISKGFIHYLDLSQEHDLKERFDWVMSIEVGEHIPEKYERIFIQNLITHACKGLVLTWSSSSRSGHYHVNARTNEYIIDLVTKMGLKHDPEAQQSLRDQATFAYLKASIMVFRVVPQKC